MVGYCISCRSTRSADDAFCIDCGLRLNKIEENTREKIEQRFSSDYEFPPKRQANTNPDRMSDEQWKQGMKAIRRERSGDRPSALSGIAPLFGIISVVLALIYGLVKFVQWAWYN